MEASLWVSKTGLDAQQMRMTVISNNLANVNTTGFKRDRAVFEDLLYQNIRQPGGTTGGDNAAPTGLMLGTGVRIVSTEKLHTQGSMIQTKNALDVAVQGEGMFQVLQPDGTMAYTRDGSFKMSVNRELVTANGEPLQPSIVIPQDAESISIGEDGVVTVQPYGNAQETTVGQIQLARFVNYAGLEPAGRNLYRETAASGQALVVNPTEDGAGALAQGALEAANVNVVEEMVNMIETQRAYEINSKAISSVDSMLRFLNQNL
ncbi:MAG: flagellar basal-body rod protein FlgG [Litorivicinaceae bacterium]|jgi:flagellar basal-body rod protein FlgG|nr:flagellar basal-body rod protein FlgG [Litorivicinaceae bacterium]MDP5328380.1 flagellar basal-body rod protein FlgG [Litorivicinaceae bacterium]MDP5330102.1 flagellar basal-body rod protein FlgG [Litorivicinaceae bacterium]MDP5344254.1 flagellar basal-body rod protein FlgG [Litorivicinaceae bacterium]MDP5364011.1 flagellar basal-body rod protein FlgG [Litorivicinaceae bacterium]